MKLVGKFDGWNSTFVDDFEVVEPDAAVADAIRDRERQVAIELGLAIREAPLRGDAVFHVRVTGPAPGSILEWWLSIAARKIKKRVRRVKARRAK